MDSRLKDIRKRLLAITKGCTDDMHEPDNQDISARIVGDHLDNAFGEHIGTEAIEEGYQEYVVILRRNNKFEKFNLADLIALARQSKG